MKRRKQCFHHFFIMAILAGGLWLAACTGMKPPDKAEPLVLGAVFSLSGYKSDLGIPSARGARLAVDQINASGGIDGRPLRLIMEDGKSAPESSGRAVASIIDNHPEVLAMLGLSDTDLARAATAAARRRQRLFLTSGATSPLLPTEFPGYLYLACFGDNVQAAAAAEWIYHARGARTVNVLYDSTETYTNLLQGYFVDSFRTLGGRVMTTRPYEPADMSRLAEGLAPVDAVFMATGSVGDALKGIQELRRAGIAVPIIGGDSFDSEDFWESHAEIGNVYYTTHAYLATDSPDPQVRRFSSAYHAAYGGNPPDAFAALGYDAVNLLGAAIRHAGRPSPGSIRQAMGEIDGFQGVTGAIRFSGGRQVPNKSVTIVKVSDGRRHLAAAFTPAEVPLP